MTLLLHFMGVWVRMDTRAPIASHTHTYTSPLHTREGRGRGKEKAYEGRRLAREGEHRSRRRRGTVGSSTQRLRARSSKPPTLTHMETNSTRQLTYMRAHIHTHTHVHTQTPSCSLAAACFGDPLLRPPKGLAHGAGIVDEVAAPLPGRGEVSGALLRLHRRARAA